VERFRPSTAPATLASKIEVLLLNRPELAK
jgi:hypothetical protein